MKKTKEQRLAFFWEHVVKSESCWVWTGARHPYGHGLFTWEGKSQYTHRISWILHRGPIPKGLYVCHHCDNPPCVNPRHLFVGTCGDNLRDMVAKGRHGKPNAKITHCPQGHEYSAENTRQIKRHDRGGSIERHCKLCSLERTRKWRMKCRARS